MSKHYETVFILNPVLSENQVKEAVKKYKDFILSKGGEMISEENWGLKRLRYPIQKKKTGFFNLFEFKVPPDVIAPFEVEFKRDEKIMRFLTVSLDKHGINYAQQRREKIKSNKEKE